MDNCLFCKIIKREIPSKIVFESDEVLAFEDISPQAPVHILIIPKIHINSPGEVTSENSRLAGLLTEAAAGIAKDLKLSDYRLVMNCGEDAGQSVFHLHMHLLAGRKMNWPPG